MRQLKGQKISPKSLKFTFSALPHTLIVILSFAVCRLSRCMVHGWGAASLLQLISEAGFVRQDAPLPQ